MFFLIKDLYIFVSLFIEVIALRILHLLLLVIVILELPILNLAYLYTALYAAINLKVCYHFFALTLVYICCEWNIMVKEFNIIRLQC